MNLHKSMFNRDILYSHKEKLSTKNPSCFSGEIKTVIRHKKAEWNRKRKISHHRQWEAVSRRKSYKKPKPKSNLLLTRPMQWWQKGALCLSLCTSAWQCKYTQLDTSNTSSNEEKSSTHLDSGFAKEIGWTTSSWEHLPTNTLVSSRGKGWGGGIKWPSGVMRDTSPGERSPTCQWVEGDRSHLLVPVTKPPEETCFPLYWQWALGDL